jgi:predicted nucleic acid-binding Zn ribbon protein
LIQFQFNPTTFGWRIGNSFSSKKSRRRADKEQRKKRRRRMEALLAATLIGSLIVAGIAALVLRY